MCVMCGGHHSNCNSERRARFGSGLHAKRGILNRVNPNDRCAPSRLFLRNVAKDHLMAVRGCVEGVLYLIDAESIVVRVVGGRTNNRYVVVIVWKALVFVRWLPWSDVMELAYACAPGLDQVG